MKKNNSLFMQIQKGVTLIEMLLVLSIMAVILLLATRYYETTRSSSLENVAIESLQAIYSAEQQYCMDRNCSTTYPSFTAFIDNGFLPSNFVDTSNPWGTITASASSYNPFVVTFSNVPAQNCLNLKNKISTAYSSTGDIRITSCPTGSAEGDMVINFY